tara:strand:- start:2897 stop:3136 length:240 start_codon:yes stop_codon:yes gene_type:complete
MPRKNKTTQLEKEISEITEELYEGIATTFLEKVIPAFIDNIIVVSTESYGSGSFNVEELKGILEVTYRETFLDHDPTLH